MEEEKNGNYYDDSPVLELTDEDFDGEKIISKKIVGSYGLLKCYAPWCGHCKSLKDDLIFLANGLKSENFKIASINSDNVATSKVCESLKIQGFPTLFMINTDGTLKNYNGVDRSIEALLAEICKHTNSKTCCRRERDELICEMKKK